MAGKAGSLWLDMMPVTSFLPVCCPLLWVRKDLHEYWWQEPEEQPVRSLPLRHWSHNGPFVAVDPSPSMLDLARANIVEAGIANRVETILATVDDLDAAPSFDAAIMIGVLHHLPGDAAKQDILAQISMRLKPGALLIVAGNYRSYASQPLLMAAWANRWRMNGAEAQEIQSKMNKILQGAEPPQSEEDVISLLTEAGFVEPVRFFSSLFWGAWLVRRKPATT